MYKYEVRIFRDGQHVDTQVVNADREGLAITAAMAYTRILFRGALATYEVKQISE